MIVTSTQILPSQLTPELQRLSVRLDDAVADLEKHSKEWAVNENSYRQAKATNFLKFQNDPNGSKRTVAAIEAIVDKECEQQRMAAYLSRAMKEAGLEKVRSLRSQLSALQSIASSLRSEMEMSGKVGF